MVTGLELHEAGKFLDGKPPMDSEKSTRGADENEPHDRLVFKLRSHKIEFE